MYISLIYITHYQLQPVATIDAGDMGLMKTTEDQVDKETANKRDRDATPAGDRGDIGHPWMSSTEEAELEVANSRMRSRQRKRESAPPCSPETSSQSTSELSSSAKSPEADLAGRSSAKLTRANVELLQKSLKATESNDVLAEGDTDIRHQTLGDTVTYWKALCRQAAGRQASRKQPRHVLPERTDTMTADGEVENVATTPLTRSKSAPQPRELTDGTRDTRSVLRVVTLSSAMLENAKKPTHRFVEALPKQSLPSRSVMRHSMPRRSSDIVADESRLLSEAGLLNVITLNISAVVGGKKTPTGQVPVICGGIKPVKPARDAEKDVRIRCAPVVVSRKDGDSLKESGTSSDESTFNNKITLMLPTVPCNSVMSDSPNEMLTAQPSTDAALDTMVRARGSEKPDRGRKNGKRAKQTVSFSTSQLFEGRSSFPVLQKTSDYDDNFRERAVAQKREKPPTCHLPNASAQGSSEDSITSGQANTSQNNPQTTRQTYRVDRFSVDVDRQFIHREPAPMFESLFPNLCGENVTTNNESLLSSDNFSENVCEENPPFLTGSVNLPVSLGNPWRDTLLPKTEVTMVRALRQRPRSSSEDTTISLYGTSKASVIDSFADDAIFDRPPEVISLKSCNLEAVPEQENEAKQNKTTDEIAVKKDGRKDPRQKVEIPRQCAPEAAARDKAGAHLLGELPAAVESGESKLPPYMVLPDDKCMFRAIAKSAAATEAVLSRNCLQHRPFQANVRDIIETFYELSEEIARGRETECATQPGPETRFPPEGRSGALPANSSPLDNVGINRQGFRSRVTASPYPFYGTLPPASESSETDSTSGP